MRAYETTFIIKPDLEEEARNNILDRVKEIIDTNGGKVNEVDEWGDRNLAYEIKNYNTGYYTLIKFEGEAETIDEMERYFNLTDSVLRYLVIREDK
ncbi:30S ribosomal protein S6 [Halothermothrix orenii]|uniref:Small ribosomal subunit protein bS6 n=1 Tax=Halothermothrix orenii (strain H 168 / OCM 544 / DSM 9562) TaxID=373903 RepID=B8D1C9_HALOH|nr:30S ribosomal protein S6 [Halothermothrix orenii]ACL71081.1 ribosomal protein S6 [Halothermothrix orenii H 168]